MLDGSGARQLRERLLGRDRASSSRRSRDPNARLGVQQHCHEPLTSRTECSRLPGTSTGMWSLLNKTLTLREPNRPESHGRTRPSLARKISPRHQRAAGPSRLRAGVVCLSGQPFSQPRARQYLDGGACRRRLLSHRVLAVPSGRDRVLYRGAAPYRSRHLGAVRAPAISLEGDRAAAARARPQHPRTHHHAHCRRAARPYPVRTRKALSAGVFRVLDRLALQDCG